VYCSCLHMCGCSYVFVRHRACSRVGVCARLRAVVWYSVLQLLQCDAVCKVRNDRSGI